MIVVSLFIALAMLFVCVPMWTFVIQIFAARKPIASQQPNHQRGSLAVVVPAHNEELGIAATIASIQTQLRAGDRLLVVADNCTDRTAEIARASGAEVLERTDELRRGKGFALSFALEHLIASPPSVAAFVDADCRLEPECLDRLAIAAETHRVPVQAQYLCESADRANSGALRSFAFRVKNLVRPLGAARFGGPCLLTGSGMAFAWDLVDDVNWATGNLVEDMQLGIDYTRVGHPPRFVPAAIVKSSLPEGDAAVSAQRKRWEHGHLLTAMNEAPELLWTAIERGDRACLLLALDLLVPPLSLLVTVNAAALFISLITASLGLGWFAPAFSCLTWLAFFAAIGVAWSRWGRDLLPLRSLAAVPFYVLAKIPLYLEFLVRRQREWVRTSRTPAKA